MSLSLVTALVLQATCLIILLATFGSTVFRKTGTYFVMAAVAYHGLTELLQRNSGQVGVARTYTTSAVVDRFTLLVSAALLAFTVVYSALSSRAVELHDHARLAQADVKAVLPWRVLALLSLPLVAATSVGRGSYGADTGTVTAGLTSQFLLLALPLTAVAYLATARRRAFPPVLALLTVLLLLLGQRVELLAGLVLLVFGLAYIGCSPSVRQLVLVAAVAISGVVLIDASRAVGSRSVLYSETGPTDRVAAVFSGVSRLSEGNVSGASGPIGDRLDGNSFGATILSGLSEGISPVGLSTFMNDLRLAVPGFLNPEKLDSSLAERSEKVALNQRFGTGIREDFLPSQLGVLLAYYGAWGLPLLAALLGALFAAVDAVMVRRPSAVGLLIGFAAVSCAMSYERSMEVYPLQARGVLPLILVAVVVARLRWRQAAASATA